MAPPKVLIAVFHTRQEPWQSIVELGQFKTWVPEVKNHGIEVNYCFGLKPGEYTSNIDTWLESLRWHRGSRISNLRNLSNKIIAYPWRNCLPGIKELEFPQAPAEVFGLEAKIWDLYVTGRWKQLALFNYFISQNQYEYLVITTSSSDLRIDLLMEQLSQFNSEYVYAGPIQGEKTSTRFISGSLLVVNRNFASLALRNKKDIPTHLLNDLGLGLLASKFGIEPTEVPSISISDKKMLSMIPKEEFSKIIHFRLKSLNQKTGERNDVKLFQELHNLLYKNNQD